ncbi:NPCBM/NEW2 domain-containing protein [Haloferula sp. BvORR071]|uniref:NPCBM/NEW2 domain-containing protein n=1 Tax=Haloferula sp. BvORR071 TaxID=1396141 RepID=UPI00054D8183|nr:NPCBM/NEW2 domain-containing protein [Haloferula sp. BvORR071]
MKIPLLLLLGAMVLATPVRAETLPEVQKAFAAQQDKISANHLEELEKLRTQLTAALGKGRETAKKAGDLDAVKAFDTEIERWKRDGDLPIVEETRPEIAKLHGVYRNAVDVIQLKKQRAVVAWFEEYEKRLGALEKTLVAADKIEDAEAVRIERNAISGSMTVRDAVDAVKKANEAKPTAAGKGSGEASGWTTLKGVKWKTATGGQYLKYLENFERPIMANGKLLERKDYIFSHAPVRVEYEFEKPITSFRADAGVAEGMAEADVIFAVETAEGEVFRSKVLKAGDGKKIDITFKPTKKLVLVVEDNGRDSGDWSYWLKPEYR